MYQYGMNNIGHILVTKIIYKESKTVINILILLMKNAN